jgi:hypothetical protein
LAYTVAGNRSRAALTLGTDVGADIFAGRLRVRLPSYDWPAATSPGVLVLPGLGSDLVDVELRIDVSDLRWEA